MRYEVLHDLLFGYPAAARFRALRCGALFNRAVDVSAQLPDIRPKGRCLRALHVFLPLASIVAVANLRLATLFAPLQLQPIFDPLPSPVLHRLFMRL
jgi:hypothetical protein